MQYNNIHPVKIIRRENRFIATVLYNSVQMRVHVKNTGRLRELIREGATGYIALSDNPTRRTPADLVAVELEKAEGSVTVNIDSTAPNDIAYEWIAESGLFSKNCIVRREVTHGDSRFDLFVEDDGRRVFIEVKGVTLVKDGVAFFPDAPTERGEKHINGLISAVAEGYEAMLLFIIAREDASLFRPNYTTDRRFSLALKRAEKSGVAIRAYTCRVTPDSAAVEREIPISLEEI